MTIIIESEDNIEPQEASNSLYKVGDKGWMVASYLSDEGIPIIKEVEVFKILKSKSETHYAVRNQNSDKLGIVVKEKVLFKTEERLRNYLMYEIETVKYNTLREHLLNTPTLQSHPYDDGRT